MTDPSTFGLQILASLALVAVLYFARNLHHKRTGLFWKSFKRRRH